jgi:hypothetical protein
MNVARVPSPTRPEKGSQGYLLWICIRMLLLFAVALLPFAAGGVMLFMGLREKTVTSQEAQPGEATEIADVQVEEVADASVAE